MLPNYDVKTDWRCVFNYDGGTATSTFGGNGRLQEAGCAHFNLSDCHVWGLSLQGSDKSRVECHAPCVLTIDSFVLAPVCA